MLRFQYLNSKTFRESMSLDLSKQAWTSVPPFCQVLDQPLTWLFVFSKNLDDCLGELQVEIALSFSASDCTPGSERTPWGLILVSW